MIDDIAALVMQHMLSKVLLDGTIGSNPISSLVYIAAEIVSGCCTFEFLSELDERADRL
jgi:hypothetical protein